MLVGESAHLRDFWYPVGFAADLASPLARRLLGVDLVVWSPTAGQVRAAVDRCPHRDGRLSRGWQEEGCLVCPYHGWAYDQSGRAVRIPQNDPGLPIPSAAVLRSVHAELRYDVVWVCLGDPVRPIPELAHHDEPGIRWIRQYDEVWQASALRVIDNTVDPAHVPWVHKGTFGSPDRPRFDIAVEARPWGLELRQEIVVDNPASARAASGSDEPTTVRRYVGHYHAPCVRTTDITYPGGVRHTINLGACPVDDTHVRIVQWCLRNDTEDDAPAAEINAFDRQIMNEDRDLLESIDPDYPLDFKGHVTVKMDRGTIEFRRILGEITAGEWH